MREGGHTTFMRRWRKSEEILKPLVLSGRILLSMPVSVTSCEITKYVFLSLTSSNSMRIVQTSILFLMRFTFNKICKIRITCIISVVLHI